MKISILVSIEWNDESFSDDNMTDLVTDSMQNSVGDDLNEKIPTGGIVTIAKVEIIEVESDEEAIMIASEEGTKWH